MTRTIDATLQNGLETKTGLFTAKVTFKRGGSTNTISIVTAFEIDEGNLTAWVKIPYSQKPTINVQNNDTIFRISRGLKIGGNEYLLDSSWFVVQKQNQNDKEIIYYGNIFKSLNYSTPGDATAQTVISNILSNSYVTGLGYSNTIQYPSDIEWWKTIQFMPTGITLRLGNIQSFNTILQQKYILNLFDIGGNVLVPIDNGQFNEYEFGTPVTPITTVTEYNIEHEQLVQKFYTWTDELNIVHTTGASNLQQHNLGFIPSTVTPFSLDEYTTGKIQTKLSPPDLRLTAEDYITIRSPKNSLVASDWFNIKETFDPSKSIPWFQTLNSIKLLGNTEGGQLSNSISKTIQYLQLNTSNFNNMLSNTENNAQAAFDLIDDKSIPVIRAKTAAPTVNDDTADGYIIGHIWIDETNDDAYICLNNAAGAAVWKKMTP